MNPQEFKDIAQGVGALLPGLALLAAALLFLWKREWRPRLQLGVGIESFCKVNGALLIEPICVVENKGLLRCYVHRLKLSVLYLRSDDDLVAGTEEILRATTFPHEAVKFQFVKPEWEWSYVEAGVRVRYSHVTHVPADAVAILVWAKLYHKRNDKTDFFTTQKIVAVQQLAGGSTDER